MTRSGGICSRMTNYGLVRTLMRVSGRFSLSEVDTMYSFQAYCM
jgi:hypothetical protein